MMASATRAAACGISVSVSGSGIRRRTDGSKNSMTASGSTPRPASTRASNSGTLYRCAIEVARISPRASSRAGHTGPVAERSRPRNAPGIPPMAGKGRLMRGSAWSNRVGILIQKGMDQEKKSSARDHADGSRFLSGKTALSAAPCTNRYLEQIVRGHHMRQSLTPQDRSPRVYVIHENDEWVVPLRDNFTARGIPFAEWHLNRGILDLRASPPPGVFYNRMSASSHTRNHRYAPELTAAVLAWLKSHGALVVNGERALQLELSKVAQYEALSKFGIETPETLAVVGKENIAEAAARLGYPAILKHNR